MSPGERRSQGFSIANFESASGSGMLLLYEDLELNSTWEGV